MSDKQKKQAIITAILLVVCLLAYLAMDHISSEQQKESEAESSKAEAEKNVEIYSLDDTSTITSFSYTYEGNTITYTLKSGQWICDAYPDMDLDETQINANLVTGLSDISGQVVGSADNAADYGMDAPENTIVINFEDGSSKTITIGSQNEFNSDTYYLQIDGDDNIYAVDSTVSSAFSSDASSYEAETESDTDATAETENESQTETIVETEAES